MINDTKSMTNGLHLPGENHLNGIVYYFFSG